MENTIAVSESADAPSLRRTWADRAGLMASLACAVHCAAMPIVISYLPSLGLSWMAGERFHQWMAGICAAIAFLAFVPGFKRHGYIAPAVLGMVGIGFLTSAAFFLEECCPSCESRQKSPSAACEACEACEACDSTGKACESVSATSVADSTSWFGNLTRFVTPLGGCILIVAHLLNHRSGCQCCSTEHAKNLSEKETINEH